MRYGFIIPGGSAPEQVELAVAAEAAGWDAVFAWEGGYDVDPWSTLAAAAARTSRIRLGTMLTPLPWRRPWRLAAQAATLDQLSAGRAILTVGLGAVDSALGTYPEETDKRARAALLDEGIDLVRALWSGERVVSGPRWSLDLSGSVHPALRPVQQPGPPVWVVVGWPAPRSLRRGLRCDGVVPQPVGATEPKPLSPSEVRELLAWYDANGGRPEDVIQEGETTGDGAGDDVAAFAEAGVTWWLESRWSAKDPADVRARIEAGPPTI